MSTTMLITMTSVCLGFVFMLSAYATYQYKKPPAVTWTLFVLAIVTLTIIPVSLAIFVAA